MDELPDLPRRRRQSLHSRKFDVNKVQQLAALGVSDPDIAKHQGVNQATIWRFLSTTRQDYQRVQQFKANRADLLAKLQGQCLDVQTRIIETLDDGVIASLKTSEKTGMLMALNATHGTVFDKERLERGQSTSNQSIVTTLLNKTVKSLYAADPLAPKLRKQKTKPAPEIG